MIDWPTIANVFVFCIWIVVCVAESSIRDCAGNATRNIRRNSVARSGAVEVKLSKEEKFK